MFALLPPGISLGGNAMQSLINKTEYSFAVNLPKLMYENCTREFYFCHFTATTATIACNLLKINMLFCGSNVAVVAAMLDFD